MIYRERPKSVPKASTTAATVALPSRVWPNILILILLFRLEAALLE